MLAIDDNKFKEIWGEIQDYLREDSSYSSGKVVGSMCTTPHPLLEKVFVQNIKKNLGDPGIFPGAKKLELALIRQIGSILGNHNNTAGHFLSGGSEANLTALWAARNHFREKLSPSQRHDLEIVLPTTAHTSFEKAADILSLRTKKIPVDNNFQVQLDLFSEAITDKTVCAVGIAGTTIIGSVDPIKDLGKICSEKDVWLHVDGAFGGLVLPILDRLGHNVPTFDFSVPGVQSFTVDPHKMGMVPIPGGIILFRDKKLIKNITFQLPYLYKNFQSTITGTRSGASTVAFYVFLRAFWPDEYAQIVKTCIENTMLLKQHLERLDFHIPIRPIINILGAVPPKNCKLDSFNLVEEARREGWRFSNVENLLRFVIMPHVKKENIWALVEFFERILDI
ncbi:MAG: tyrosine decarboxylase MfnA [Promethearchaeota archaeon]